jgi:hypothetical protein
MMAASGTETAPVAVPLTTPQRRKSCHGSDDDPERHRDHAAHPEALHQAGREGRTEPEAEQVQRDGEPDRPVAPAELLVERHEQDAGRRAKARGHDERDEADADHDPRVVQTPEHARSLAAGEALARARQRP